MELEKKYALCRKKIEEQAYEIRVLEQDLFLFQEELRRVDPQNELLKGILQPHSPDQPDHISS